MVAVKREVQEFKKFLVQKLRSKQMTQKNAEEMWKQISTNLRMTEFENYRELHKESDTREGERKN